jgi:hypothetical protein
VDSAEEVYVVLTEMFQSGWQLKIDDKVQSHYFRRVLFFLVSPWKKVSIMLNCVFARSFSRQVGC